MKLQAIVTQYVAFRKSLGAGFRANEKVLKSFCRALEKSGERHRYFMLVGNDKGFSVTWTG
jgi:hypothetical protein